MNPLQRAGAVGRHVDPAADLLLLHELRPQGRFDGLGHTATRFAAADDDNAANRIERDRIVANQERFSFDAQILRHESLRQHRIDARPPNLQGIAAKLSGSGHTRCASQNQFPIDRLNGRHEIISRLKPQLRTLLPFVHPSFQQRNQAEAG